jgi:hypothetical protein
MSLVNKIANANDAPMAIGLPVAKTINIKKQLPKNSTKYLLNIIVFTV